MSSAAGAAEYIYNCIFCIYLVSIMRNTLLQRSYSKYIL